MLYIGSTDCSLSKLACNSVHVNSSLLIVLHLLALPYFLFFS